MVMTGVVAAAAVARSGRVLAQWRRVPDLSRNTGTGSVVAVVPARNEEATLGSLLAGLTAQTHDDLRVIVVDDASTDGTASIARSFGVEVVRGDGPPHGWSGKVHAMHLGVEASGEEEWLLFMDADVVPAPDLVGRLIATAEEIGADLVSSAARADQTRPSWWFLLPAFNTLVFEGSPPDGRGATALGVGHCILVRRKAFERAGGWITLAGTCADDVGIATAVRDSGGVPRYVDASAYLTTSGLDGFGQTWLSLRKSLVPSMQEITGSRTKAIMVLALAGVVHVVFGLAPVVAILRRRWVLGAVAWAAQAAAHREFVRRIQQPEGSAVLAPLSWAAVGALLLDCAWRTVRGGTTWKDRRVG